MAKKGIMAITLLACLFLASCKDNSGTESTPPASPSPPPSAAVETPTPTPTPTFSIETDRQDAIYNVETVKAVYLGMSRAELEKLCEPGDTTENGYTAYDDYGFFVKFYGNDTVKELVIYERDFWQTYNGISFGSTVEELVAAYGEPLAITDGVYAYYTLDNELLTEMPSFAEVDINYLYSVDFIVEDDTVVGVMLSRF